MIIPIIKKARAYHRLWSFMGRDQNVDTGLQISQLNFQRLHPLYYFSLQYLELSRQSDINMHFSSRVALPGCVDFFKLIDIILSDKSLLFESGSGRMRVVDAPVENMHTIYQSIF